MNEAEEGKAFRLKMKRVANLLKNGKTLGDDDVEASLEDAFGVSKEGGKSVARSARARKLISGARWTKLSPEQQQSLYNRLGDESYRALRAYDETLEALAKMVYTPKSKRR